MYRIIVTSDWHCGAATGLTNMEMDCGKSELVPYQERRTELWNMFTSTMKKLHVADEMWVLGDVINGPGSRVAKRDNLNNVLEQQCTMAEYIFDWIRQHTTIEKFLIVEGTEWHVGDGEMERSLAGRIGAAVTKGKIVTRAGVAFDIRHAIGGSNRPHLHGNALVQEYDAAVANANRHGTAIPNVIIRAHRHVFDKHESVCYRDGQMQMWTGIILPSLQAWGSDYAKKVSGSLFPDVGFVCIDVYEGKWEVTPYLFHLKSQVK